MQPISVKKNFLYNVSYQLLLMVLPLITAPYLSRVLGVDGIGVYSYTFSIASLFVMFSLLGINNHGSRAIAVAKSNKEELCKTFWNIYAIQLGASAAVLAAYLVYVFVFLSDYFFISVVWGLYVASAMLDINWFFFGLERFKITTIRNFIIKLSTFVLMFVFVHGPEDLIKYAVLIGVSYIVSQGIMWPLLLREIGFCRPSKKEIVANLKPVFVLFVPVIAISVYTQLDKVILGLLSDIDQVAYFDNALKITGTALTVVTALGTVMIPRISALLAEGRQADVRQYMDKSICLAMLLSLALAFGIGAIAFDFAPIYFGEAFRPSGLVMLVLAAYLPFMAWANVIRTQYLIPKKKDSVYVVSVILGAIINVVVNVFLVPHFGAIGAAIATVLSEIVVCLYQTWCVRADLPITNWLKLTIVFLPLAAIMGCCVKFTGFCLGATVFSVVLQIVVGVFAYAVVLLIYSRMSNNQYLSELMQAVSKKLK